MPAAWNRHICALLTQKSTTDDFETLLENAFDPGHIPFAHHGPLGSRNSMSFGLYSLKPVDVPSPLSLGAQYRNIQGIETLLTYHFPCVVQYVGQTSTTTVISIPVRPGTCKLITIFQPAKFSWIMKFIPTWVAHALSGYDPFHDYMPLSVSPYHALLLRHTQPGSVGR